MLHCRRVIFVIIICFFFVVVSCNRGRRGGSCKDSAHIVAVVNREKVMHNISIVISILTTTMTNWQFVVKGECCTLGVGGVGSNAENALKVQLLPPGCIGAYGINDVAPGAPCCIHCQQCWWC